MLCANDVLALWTFRVMADLGGEAPTRFMIIGIDDTQSLCPFTQPTLSSVRLDFPGLIGGAVRLLEGALDGRVIRVEAPGVESVVVRDSTRSEAEDPFNRAMSFIRTHAHENPSLDRIAQVARIHPRALQRQFRLRLDASPSQVLLRERLAIARNLLASSEMSVQEIAVACGYESPQRFIAAFKRSLGETPGRFRARQASANRPPMDV